MGKHRLSLWLELAAWWAVLMVVYLASLTTAKTAEYVAAALAGFVSAVLAVAARRAARAAWRVPRRIGRMALLLPVAAACDAVRTLGLLTRPGALRHMTGSLTELVLPVESPRAADGRRAIGSVLISATPASLVIDEDPGEGRLTVHRLVQSSPDPAEEVVKA
jgi:multisubunit Na+/H+ antiporter MnhE subunit